MCQVSDGALVHVTDQLLTDLLKVIRRSLCVQQEVLLGTLLHAHLGGGTAVQGRRQVNALGEIEEDEVRLVQHRTVQATPPVHGVGGHDEPLGLSILVRVSCDHGPRCDEGHEQEETKDVCAGTPLAWSLEVWIELQRFTCRRDD